MTSDEHVFGSGRLTPELLRSASFDDEAGRYDAESVRAFLDRAASALEVLMADDASIALRAEFSRNAEIAQQVLDAGQTAAAQLREQAGADARRLLEETRESAASLRTQAEGEVAEARAEAAELSAQAESARSHLVQDMRDLYDRIGASLYRFERAEDERVDRAAYDEEIGGAAAAQLQERRRHAEEPIVSPIEYRQDRRDSASENGGDAAPAEAASPLDAQQLPEGAFPPAWQQLAPESEESIPEAAPEASPGADQPLHDPFAVIEDEPLAPGEPLVDLRDQFGTGSPADTDAGSWLADAAPAPEAVPAPADDGAGSWLDAAPAPDEAAVLPQPDAATIHDNALAEALIGGSPFPDAEPAPEPAAAPIIEDVFTAPAVPSLAVAPPPSSGATAVPPPAAAAATTPPVPPAPAPAPAPVSEQAPAEPEPWMTPDATDHADGPSTIVPASADANAVRDLILNSLADGHPREAVEAYLRDELGMIEPGVLIDAALGTSQPQPQPPA